MANETIAGTYWGKAADPIKIGLYLTDPDMPNCYTDVYQMVFKEYYEKGLINRPVELVIKKEDGLPFGTAKKDENGFREFVDEGCICVMAPASSDNLIVLGPVADELHVPVIGWAGTERFNGPYCFRMGNGDCGGDPALIAQWVKSKGLSKVGVVCEVCPNGDEYFDYFRRHCRRLDITMVSVETMTQNVSQEKFTEVLGRMKEAGAEALVYMGYGMFFIRDMFNIAFKELDWDPLRITTTAFMFYLMGFNLLEGWVGVDQYCPENPRVQEFLDKYDAEYDDEPILWPNAIPLLAYDTAVAVAEGLFNAPAFTPEGMKTGLERLRWIPTACGGPQAHISGAPNEHNLLSGDWLLLSKIENEEIKHEALFSGAGF